MKPFTFAFFLFFVGILAMSPILTASASADTKFMPYRIELDGSARIIPYDVHYERRNDGLVITGRIKKRWHYWGRIVGHVDIRLLNSEGEMISETKALIYGRSPTPRNPEKARFSVTVDSIPVGISTIEVSHHAGG